MVQKDDKFVKDKLSTQAKVASSADYSIDSDSFVIIDDGHVRGARTQSQPDASYLLDQIASKIETPSQIIAHGGRKRH